MTFTDLSTNTPTSWFWDFGDGATSPDRNPSHEYRGAGTYTVKLTAANGDGSDDEVKANFITVSAEGQGPTARFLAFPTQGTAPLSVLFADISRGSPVSRLWDFGDGSTSTERYPVHTYMAAGKYTVKLTVTNAAGSDTLTREDYITVRPENPPKAQFAAYPRQGKAPLTVLFVDLSRGNVGSRLWDFGDGSTSAERFAVHTYENPGRYTVKLTVTNSGGTDTMTRVNYIRVNAERPPDAQFTASPRAGTAPLEVSFRDLSKGSVDSRLWDFGDGSTSIEEDPVHIYATPGTYSVSLTVVNDAGSDTAVMKNYIKVNEKKQGTPGPDDSGGEAGDVAPPEDSKSNEKPKIKIS
ncbi:MAG: PKD domain-containing protein [Methanomicrobiales archaeon]|nr:PKD domain-containing protein [Methanomicrobiales archaeon]